MVSPKLPSYSVLMSVYKKETAAFLGDSIESMLSQTLPFNEFVIVKDGPLTPELDEVLEKYSKNDARFKIVTLKKNQGLGIALNHGLKKCKNDLILRIDSDDVALSDRAKKQIDFMIKHPDVDVLGGNIFEFKEKIDEPNRRLKKMPNGNNIHGYIIKRNPLNHMTVCFRKSKIEEVGSYEPLPLMEDYWLWVRLYCKNGKIENINQVLTYARIGNGFEKRRGNKVQMKSWKTIQNFLLENHLIDNKRKAINILNMWIMIHSPVAFRKTIYRIIRK